MEDFQLVCLYREWSEIHWAAGFINPTPELVSDFIQWLAIEESRDFFDYELEFIEEFRRQNTEDPRRD